MSKFHNSKSIKLINSIILALSVVACSTNQINSTSFNNDKSSISNKSNSFDLNKTFKVKYASAFNPTAYFLTYQDVRDAIKNKTVPDVFYHHYYTQNSETYRVTDSTYLQTKTRIESGEFSEEAYLIANPDVKSAVDAGTIQSGYAHWYSYASTNETTRKTKQEYIDAKAAIDAGFNEKAYRMRYPDIDNLVKNNGLPSAYIHYNTWAKNNEPTKLTDTRYVKIKNAVLEGYDENAYLLAYPDVKS